MLIEIKEIKEHGKRAKHVGVYECDECQTIFERKHHAIHDKSMHFCCRMCQNKSQVLKDKCVNTFKKHKFEKSIKKETKNPCKKRVKKQNTLFYVYVDFTREEIPRAFYVGKGELGRVHRTARNLRHKNVRNLYGFNRVVILSSYDEDFTLLTEKEKIIEYKTRFHKDGDFGCNFTDGGDGCSGLLMSEEALKQNSISHTGKVYSKEVCDKKRNSMLLSKKVHRRPVRQLSQELVPICDFKSISDASKLTNIPVTSIMRACKLQTIRAGKYFWRYLDDNKKSVTRSSNGFHASYEVVQLTFDNVFVKLHNSIMEANRTINAQSNSVSLCCIGKRKTAYGFKWRKADEIIFDFEI
jgi:hypothetical protein